MAGGIDSFTKLLLHMNGADESTTFEDSSDSNHTVTANGDAQIDTAESQFGGASGLFDGTGDYLTISDSSDWDFGSGDFTVDFWIKLTADTSTFRMPIGQWGAGGSNGAWTIAIRNTDVLTFFYSTDGVSEVGIDSSYSFTDTDWHHIAVVRDGNTLRFFVDGVAQGTGSLSGVTLNNSTRDLTICAVFDSGSTPENFLNGHLDELRISKGVARWTSNFTPPTEEYSKIITINETILINEVTDNQSSIKRINESIILNESTSSNVDAKFATKIISTNPLIFVTNTDPVELAKVDVSTPESPIIEIKVLSGVTGAQDVSYNSNTGFLYVACEDGKVVKVELADLSNQTTIDLSDTDNLLTIESLSNFGLTYAGTNNDTGELYLIDERDTAVIDINAEFIAPKFFPIDTDFNLIETAKIDCNFNLLSEETGTITCDFKLISSSINDIDPIDLQDFRVFIDNVELENTDLVLNSISITHTIDEESEATFQLTRNHDNLNTTKSGNTVTITNQNAVRIEIDGNIEFNGNISRIQPVYDSSDHILVQALDTEKTNKYHKVNLSLPDFDSPLSLYNVLISNPDIFNPVIDATNEDNPKKFKGIRASLGDKIEQQLVRRIFFDEFGSIAEDIQNGDFNPLQNHSYFWSPTVRLISANPTEIEQVGGVTFKDAFGNEFTLGQATLELFKFTELNFSQTRQIFFPYIGTSLSPVTEDIWELIQARHRRQRIFEDKVTKLGDGSVTASDFNEVADDPTNAFNELVSRGYLTAGGNITQKFKETQTFEDLDGVEIPGNEIGAVYEIVETHLGYTVGEAPFRDISVRNGVFVTKFKYVDEPDGLYSIKDPAFDFTDYVKQVADLEYQKLLNINGEILPETTASLQVTVDGYYYYDLSLATRINIDNTINANEFKDNNGFPLSIKSITITSADRKVNIQADNLKSTKELEAIDGEFPDETSDQFNEKEQRNFVAQKADMKSRLEVE